MKPLAQVCATSSKEGCSPLQLFGTHMGSFTLSADKTSGITVPCPKPRGSFREHSLKGSLRSHSLRSLFSTRPVTKIIGLSREDTKTHWAKAIPSPNSLWFTVSCSNMPVESLQVIRVSNTLIVTPTLDQSKLVAPPLLQHDSTGVLSADPEETPPSVVQQNHNKTQLNTWPPCTEDSTRVQTFHMEKQLSPASPFAFL